MIDLALRPTRGHVLPALVALFPAEWFVLRAVGTAAVRDGPVPARDLVAGSLGALLLAYAVSVAVASAARTRGPDGALARALRPTDATLAVLAVVLAGTAGYFVASLFVVPTGPLGSVFAALGVLVGLPLVLAHAASVAAGNALGLDGLGTAAVVVGLAASAVWTFGLAAAAGRLLRRVRSRPGARSRRDRED